MVFDAQVVASRIEPLVRHYDELKSRTKYDDFSDLPREEVTELVTRMFAEIERLSPPNSRYVENARAYSRAMGGNIGIALTPFLGILRALRSDYAAGNLRSVAELIRADAKKARVNQAKHRVSFEEAMTVFRDPLARIFDDEAHSEDEKREIIIGHSVQQRLLLVSFTGVEDSIRLLSARKATRLERKDYEENVSS